MIVNFNTVFTPRKVCFYMQIKIKSCTKGTVCNLRRRLVSNFTPDKKILSEKLVLRVNSMTVLRTRNLSTITAVKFLFIFPITIFWKTSNFSKFARSILMELFTYLLMTITHSEIPNLYPR